jgi:hypothetical protein
MGRGWLPNAPHLGDNRRRTNGWKRRPVVNFDDLPNYLTADDLESFDITVEDIRRLEPQPVEYVGLDGRPCRRLEALAAYLGGDQ